MAEPHKNGAVNARAAAPKQVEFDIDFNAELPTWDFFPIWYLAERWHCSPAHVINLTASGELPVGVDLRDLKSSRSMIRVPRKSVVEFLNRRKNLEKVAAANPRPKYREKSKRKPRA